MAACTLAGASAPPKGRLWCQHRQSSECFCWFPVFNLFLGHFNLSALYLERSHISFMLPVKQNDQKLQLNVGKNNQPTKTSRLAWIFLSCMFDSWRTSPVKILESEHAEQNHHGDFFFHQSWEPTRSRRGRRRCCLKQEPTGCGG